MRKHSWFRGALFFGLLIGGAPTMAQFPGGDVDIGQGSCPSGLEKNLLTGECELPIGPPPGVVPPPVPPTCAAGTQWNPETRTCEFINPYVLCSPGKIFEKGRCVPDCGAEQRAVDEAAQTLRETCNPELPGRPAICTHYFLALDRALAALERCQNG